MDLRVHHEGSREVDRDFRAKLDEYNRARGSPRIKVRWNPVARKTGVREFDPRWEIWVELIENQLTREDQAGKKDRYEDSSWWRFLQTWEYPDDTFLPLDDRFFQAAHEADTWTSREHYDERLVRPEEVKKEREWKDLLDVAGGVGSHWRGWGKTMVGAATRGDWRAKEWWR